LEEFFLNLQVKDKFEKSLAHQKISELIFLKRKLEKGEEMFFEIL